MFIRLPPGSGRYKTIWNLDRHEWGDIHFWIALLLLLILTYHLFLHWRWIKSLVRGKKKQYSGFRKRLAMGSLLLIWALTFSPVFSPVKNIKSEKANQSAERMTHIKDSLDHTYEDKGPK